MKPTQAATRGDEFAVIEAMSPDDGAVVGHYSGSVFVAWVPIQWPPSVASVIAALPGSGWVGNPACDEWIQASIAETT